MKDGPVRLGRLPRTVEQTQDSHCSMKSVRHIIFRMPMEPSQTVGNSSGDGSKDRENVDDRNEKRQRKVTSKSRSANARAKQKSEVQQYLEDNKFPRDENFDILSWWKINSPRLPTLVKMARDVLAVPATTVASESAFSTGGRIIDETRVALLPEIVKCLVTTSDWINNKTSQNVDETEGGQT